MSMMYCDIHHRHFDSDFETDCPECEEEEVAEIPGFEGTREDLDKISIR